jgi:hypothetical protein
MIAGFKRKHTITSQKKQELKAYENIELHFRQVEKFDEWWQAVCFAAGEMDFARSSLRLVERSGAEKTLVWKKENAAVSENEMVRMIVPVRDRRANSSLNIEVQVYANGSLESVGRRFTLFSRLIEKYSVENL